MSQGADGVTAAAVATSAPVAIGVAASASTAAMH